MSEKFIQKVSKIFLGTSDTELLKEIKPLKDKYNYKALIFSTLSFMPFLIILSVFSMFIYKMRWMMGGYIFFTCCMIILFVLSRLPCVKKNNKLILFFLYSEIFFTVLFAILVGNFGAPDIAAVSYHVFLVVLPLFICDSPWRLNCLYILFLIPFLVTSYKLKNERIFVYDVMNGCIYTVLGIFINTKVQISHFGSFSNRCLIKKQRDTDMLTGALTKKAFEVKVQSEMRKTDYFGVFMIFDIDNFKNINDTLGHAVGDYFISNTGHLILNHCRQTDIVGRFGGDEFVIFMPGITSVDIVNRKADEFMSSLKEYFTNNMNYEGFSISIGSTFYNNPTQTYKEIFNEMDTALYDAKKSGKDKCCIYHKN